MKIAVDCNMRELAMMLSKYEGISETYQITDKVSALSFLNEGVDAVIISDQLCNENQIKELMEQCKGTVTFYQITKDVNVDRMKRASLFCSTYGVILLPPYLDAEGLTKEVLTKLFPCQYQAEKENVYVFMSTHPGVGATSIVHSIAQAIAEGSSKKVVILHLNPYSEGLISKEHGKSLDEIYIHLKNDALNFSNVYHFLTKYKGFWVLQGNRDLKRIYEYNPEHIKRLIHVIKEEVDIVLIDTGPYFDNALSLEALSNSDFYYVVGTQQYKTIGSFTKYFEQILRPLGYKHNTFSFIGNKVKSSQTSIKSIAKGLGISLLIEVPFIDYSVELEQQEKTLLDFKATRNRIVSVAQGITPINNRSRTESSEQFSFLQFVGLNR